MDRGSTFKLISNYVNMITATDSKVSPKLTGNPAGRGCVLCTGEVEQQAFDCNFLFSCIQFNHIMATQQEFDVEFELMMAKRGDFSATA